MRTFTKSQGAFVLVPEGSHPAQVIGVGFLGFYERVFQNRLKRSEIVGLQYELLEPDASDGRYLAITEELTFSTHERSTFSKRLRALLGKEPEDGFEYSNLLKRPCIITVVHRDWQESTFANVENVSPPIKGIKVSEPSITPFLFDIEEASSPEEHERLPGKWRKMLERRVGLGARTSVPEVDEDIPF